MGELECNTGEAASRSNTWLFTCFGSPAILGSALGFPPLDRWLCVPTFRWVCPLAATMHKGPGPCKGIQNTFRYEIYLPMAAGFFACRSGARGGRARGIRRCIFLRRAGPAARGRIAGGEVSDSAARLFA